MPPNTKNSELSRNIIDALKNGDDTIDKVWLTLGFEKCSRSTVRKYLEDWVKLGAVTVNREYSAHRYTLVGSLDSVMAELEYYLPRIDDYRAQKVPFLVNEMIKRWNTDTLINDGRRDGRIYVLLALAARSEDTKQLQQLCQKVIEQLFPAFMDYRLFDTISKRGIDKTRDAKKLFALGDMGAHEANVAFRNLFTEVFGPSPQTSA